MRIEPHVVYFTSGSVTWRLYRVLIAKMLLVYVFNVSAVDQLVLICCETGQIGFCATVSWKWRRMPTVRGETEFILFHADSVSFRLKYYLVHTLHAPLKNKRS